MPLQKRVMLIGDYHDLTSIAALLQKESFAVDMIGEFSVAQEAARKDPPDAIVFVLPMYWQNVTDFVEKIGKELPHTEFIYVGGLLEGADQAILQAHNVKTFTLGPVPEAELARFVKKLLW